MPVSPMAQAEVANDITNPKILVAGRRFHDLLAGVAR